jgi:signal peptidase I
MILLLGFVAGGMLSLLLTAWILAVAAHCLKSPRGKLRFGVLATALVLVINLGQGLFILSRTRLPSSPTINPIPGTSFTPTPELEKASPQLVLFIGLLGLALQFAVLQRVFALRTGRAFGLWGIGLLWSCVQLAIAVFIIRPYVMEAVLIPTASMSPTLVPADHVLANKLAHPGRWDLVIYHPPSLDGKPVTDMYCKRLVGLPGERLRFNGGQLYINDQPVAAPAVVAGKYSLQMPRGKYREGETITLRDNEVFLIGDNTMWSFDSRLAGPSKLGDIQGVAQIIYWPFDRVAILRSVSSGGN